MNAATAVAEFNRELESFALGIEQKLVPMFVKRVVLRGYDLVFKKTPVDTGHARANWQVEISSSSGRELAGEDYNAAYSLALRLIDDQCARDPSVVFHIVNNVDYILILEEGRIEGSGFGAVQTAFGEITGKVRARGSRQAPNGMLAISFEELVAWLHNVEDDLAR